MVSLIKIGLFQYVIINLFIWNQICQSCKLGVKLLLHVYTSTGPNVG